MSNEIPQEHESETPHHVTIPYFLYEAMARSYYGNPANSDVPVESDKTYPTEKESLNLSEIYFNPSDVPPNWRPGGTAARKHKNVASQIQSAEEEA